MTDIESKTPSSNGRQHKPPTAKEPSPPPDWLTFFSAKSGNAATFVKQQRKYVSALPSAEELRRIAELVLEKPARVSRLLSVLQSLGSAADSIADKACQLAEIILSREQSFQATQCFDAERYFEAAMTWLVSLPHKALSQKASSTLYLLTLLGKQRGWLTEHEAVQLLTTGFIRPKKSKRPTPRKPTLPQEPVDVLLSAPAKKPTTVALLKYANACNLRFKQLEEEVGKAKGAQTAAEEKDTQLSQQCSQLKEEIRKLQAELAGLEQAVKDEKQRVADTQTHFQHLLHELRGHALGILQGELTRWLENAYEAVSSAPPRAEVVKERLESALTKIRKEISWLQTLD